MQKQCFKCNEVKPVAEFYRHPQMADGRLGKCKDCTKRDALHHRRKNLERIRQYDKSRGNRQTAEYRRMWRQMNPEKYKAHCAVNNAVRDGRLHKPAICSRCLQPADWLHGHHADYSQPLAVDWVCPACHAAEHH